MYSSACMQNNRLTITQKAASTFFSWAKFTKKSGKKRKQFLLPTLRSVRLTDRDTWVCVCESVWEWVRVCVSMCIFECVSALLLLLLLTSWPHTRICLTARDHDKWLFVKLRIFAQERRWTESDMHPFLVPSRTFCAFSIVTSTVWQSMVPTMRRTTAHSAQLKWQWRDYTVRALCLAPAVSVEQCNLLKHEESLVS